MSARACLPIPAAPRRLPRARLRRQSLRRAVGLAILLCAVGAAALGVPDSLGQRATGTRPPLAKTTPAVTSRPPAKAPLVVVVAPFSAPASLPGLGAELARGLVAALREAGIEAQPGSAASASDPALDGRVITGRIEQISSTGVRLHATFRNSSVQSIGDLEHLDDLVFSVFSQLRPRLTLAPGPPAPPGSPPGPAVGEGPDTPVLAAAPPDAAPPSPKPASPPKEKELAKIPSGPPKPVRPASPTPTGTSGVTLASTSPSAPGTTKPAPGPSPAVKPPAPATTPTTTPTATTAVTPKPPAPVVGPPAPAVPDGGVANSTPAVPAPKPRPRLSIHIVGEPVSPPPPPGFYGLGAYAQQALMQYAQSRLKVTPVASRLIGLVGGLDALGQSLRLGARHTLMVRLDTLLLTGTTPYAGFAGGSLSGRAHVVLLLDGKLLLDRSVVLPQTAFQPGELPASVLGRALTAAMELLTGDLLGLLG